jgi:arylsulfatase A-like enzyme
MAALAQQPKRPNFIVLYTDDQGIGDLGCYGAKDVKTPHLDRLAARGIRLTSWYSSSPVCSPSRAALMTGLYPHRTGIRNFLPGRANRDVPGLRATEVTLPGLLKQTGYRTAAIGKWHLGSAPASRPLKQGFDQFFGFYSGWIDNYSHRYYQMTAGNPQEIYHDMWRDETEAWEEPVYHTELFTREARAFLEKQTSAQPFFLYLAYGAPHYPMIAPKKYLDRFPADLDPDRRTHAGMLAAVDDSVGELMAVLKKRGLDRDTVVFFQSDNGATNESRSDSRGRPYRGGSNAPYRGYKGGLFEGGIRMPALMSWPANLPANAVNDTPAATMDILPTFVEWAGGRPPECDGRSVSGMLKSGGASPHEALFWEYQKQFAVRQGDWKLMEAATTGLGEASPAAVWLSNLKADPQEARNWADQEPAVVARLKKLLEEWRRTTGA